MQCTLDFLTNSYGQEEPVPGRDGNLVAEIGLMLRIARETSLVGTLDPFACRLADDPSLQCLDIGAPSTLGGFVDPAPPPPSPPPPSPPPPSLRQIVHRRARQMGVRWAPGESGRWANA